MIDPHPPPELLRSGHTAFRSGQHGDGWLEKGEVVRDPQRLDEVAAVQAAQIGKRWPDATLTVGASQCGAVLAAFVARHLGWPVAFVNIGADGGLTMHRMHLPAPGQRVVLVDDLISTGTDARAAVRGLRALGHEVLGLSVWTVRASAVLPDVPVSALWPAPYQSFDVGACPLCAAGEPVRWVDVRE